MGMTIERVVLHDVDGRIPNLALMKLSAWHRRRGRETVLDRSSSSGRAFPGRDGGLHFASAVFRTPISGARMERLQALYGTRLEAGGSGFSLAKRLPPEVEDCFPDYSLYRHTLYALGFLTRGCNKRCAFCVVPAKEGGVKLRTASFEDFVPPGQRNVMLFDDNLLAYREVEGLLEEMIHRDYAVNFSQTLDIAHLNERNYPLLQRIDYRNSRFNKRMIYFSLNYPATIRLFMERRDMLKGFGEDSVTVVCIYGFDTGLSADYQRFLCLRRLRLLPFLQEYWPIEGVPNRLPTRFFDMDLNEMIHLTFRSNGMNWEKYLRWLNQLYFHTFGKYYRPLVEIIYRYNNKERLQRYLRQPEVLTNELYRDFRSDKLQAV